MVLYRVFRIGLCCAGACGKIEKLALIAAIGLPVALSGSAALAQAQNSTCSVSSGTATCADIPMGGVSYSSGVDRINSSDPTPADRTPTQINNGTVGIRLTKSGGDGSDGVQETVANKILNNNGTPDDADDDFYELADGNGVLVLDDNGNRIRVQTNSDGAEVLTDAAGNPLALTDIDNYLATLSGGSGGVAVGAVTVVNAANLQTSNASGIVASSTGGNGGKGGTINILFIGEIGKSGGSGRDGSSVAVTNDGTITVSGANQYGVVATSQGGKGGDGGGIGALISKAGSGGDGGDGGEVFVDLRSFSDIETTGDGGHGVYAQSLGGDGGRGGNTGGAVALGSSGGDGGSASTVTVNNAGDIETHGSAAYGIYALSHGAGAGSGSSTGGIVAIGGNGGSFADGGAVTVSNGGEIITRGTGSFGLIAQSVGGGGGDGGNSGGVFSVGGRAGSGGDGNVVSVTQSSVGSITTMGDRATALVAQSIGGGGGNGGNATSVGPAVAVSIGGTGGPGGDGGHVTVEADGSLTTGGAESNAILAQSVGGGGGNGGRAISASVDVGAGITASVAVGGSGGEGGVGGVVDVTSGAVIATEGERSSGIVAQSIGGGGGNGGMSIAGSISSGAGANVSVAGGGAGGGSASAVSVDVDGGSITTEGVSSYGIFAQSVGGGGGSGGLSVAAGANIGGSINVGLGGAGAEGGIGSTVDVSNVAAIETIGEGSYGIFAQSVGGGGGNGGLSVAAGLSATATIGVSIGGSGGGGNNASAVDVDNTGRIITRAAQAYGILAQSVGGGGGAGGNAIAASAAGGLVAGSVSFGLGGSGGGGAAGGHVTLDNINADVTTEGAGSTALIAQSIGGGGGTGGFSVAAALTASKNGGAAIGVGLGGNGGDGGTGGVVDLNNSGTLSTQGDAASGIIAQSLGGAGGVGGLSVAGALNISGGGGASVGVSLGGSGGDGGFANDVTVDNDGNITTRGADAYGVLAQSVGGSGGVGGLSVAGALNGTSNAGAAVGVSLGGGGGNGGTASAVTVTNDGVITTTGARAIGVAAQSIGGDGGAGGLSVGLGLSASTSSGTGAASVSLGGSGGDGGTAGAVRLTNNANVSTLGLAENEDTGERINTDAFGLLAQSIGGSGGVGGIGGSAAIAVGHSNSAAASVAVGGTGGDGGIGGTVDLANFADIATTTDRSHGIVAQSVGGNGGAGGASVNLSFAFTASGGGASGSVGASVGGFGGDGGRADRVSVDSIGNVTTGGESAYGILAQSIGGNGGAGGFSVNASGSVTRSTGGSIGLSVGGFGGSGAQAGNVIVGDTDAIDGVISTTGANSAAIVAQSIGGSGGAGGFSGSLNGSTNTTAGSRSLSLGVSVGGGGGGGGRAGTVNVTTDSTAQVFTKGDFAYGILAQSVGGSGGNGGGSVAMALGGKDSINAALSVGGFGGDGSIGNAVTVVNGGQIVTGDPAHAHAGKNAHGIVAQSIGGNGGTGGFSSSITFSQENSYSLSASVGGFGGTGNHAGLVDVTNDGTIVVFGENAVGILAQSIGGGGGAGGDTGLGSDVWGEDFLLDTAAEKILSGNSDELDLGAGGAYAGSTGANSHSLAVSVGGFGGAGGDGSTVDLSNAGTIVTFGTTGHAIQAQSIGGGGGKGGISTAASAALSASNTGSYALALGGFGGAAGDGDTVTVNNSGEIITVYHGAYGIYAQSVGGGGGDGGSSRGFTLQRKDESLGKSLKPGKQLAMTVGGFAGAGGDGGDVNVTNSEQILTFGSGSIGIFGQSIGGGGGDGGSSSVSSGELGALFDNDSSVKKRFRTQKFKLAIGGFGGLGGEAGTVNINNAGDLRTRGDGSTGIYAQAVGGGGGSGGKAGTGLTGDFSIGGFGGAASDGGKVIVSNTGLISTEGHLADGIFAQSIGGGGGEGGNADFGSARSFRGDLIKAIRNKGLSAGLKDLRDKIFMPSFGVAVGGFGGAAGDGETVTVCNGATYDTASGTCSGTVSDAAIVTTGTGSHGIFAQSVGGGGGVGGAAYLTNVGKIGIGGLGGAAGDGGDVSVVQRGDITTTGHGSYGIFAQSVGGGGGLAGDITFGIENIGIDEFRAVRDVVSGFFDGPGVDLDDDGELTDEEKAATQDLFNGVLDDNGLPISDEAAASFVAAFDGLDQATKDSILSGLPPEARAEIDDGEDYLLYISSFLAVSSPTSVVFKSSVFDFLNGVTGDGGKVTVSSEGTIIATGGASEDLEQRAGSIGIFAQSIGGGGGIVANTRALSEAELEIDLNGDGDMTDIVEVSDGTAFAGSIGGSGTGGEIRVDHSGSIYAPSWNGYGIFAQSTGGDGGSDITINIDGGVVQGGENIGAAIQLDGGADNAINIAADSFVYAMSKRALYANGGNETVTSSGYVQGNVDLGGGTNAYTNQSGGVVDTRTTFNLNGGLLRNDGDVILGGLDTVGTTSLTGDFVQSSAARYFVDLSFGVGAGASDVMMVSGSADVAGTILPTLQKFARVRPAETVISAAGGVADTGITVVDSFAIDYEAIIEGNDLKIAIAGIDFTFDGLTTNQTNTGGFIETILNGDGSIELSDLFAFLGNEQDPEVIAAVMERMHHEAYSALFAPTLFSALDFTNQLMSCPVNAEGVGAVLKEGQCFWARATGGHLEIDAARGYSDVSETSYAFSTGVQFNLDSAWSAGFAAEYEDARIASGNLARTDGDRASIGGTLKFQSGSWMLAGGATAGHGWFDTERFVNLGGILEDADLAQSSPELSYVNARLRAANLIGFDGWYLKPMVDVNATYLYLHGFHETGAGALNLTVDDTGEWVFSATPAIEIGAQIAGVDGYQIRPYARAGATVFSEDLFLSQATFEGTPLSAGVFTAGSHMDAFVAELSAGIDILSVDNSFDLRFGYDGRLGEDVETHVGTVKFSTRF